LQALSACGEAAADQDLTVEVRIVNTPLEQQRGRLKVVDAVARHGRKPARRPHPGRTDSRAPSEVSQPPQAQRLPAYAAALLERRTQGLAPCGDLLISTDWKLGRAWSPWRIVADPSVDPGRFDFTVCAGLSCLLVGRNQVHLDAVARAVMRVGPARLIVVHYRKAQISVCAPSPSRSAGAP
jgi:hypothetical protein